MAGPVPFYGSRQDPNGRGSLVRGKDGREFLFTGPSVEGFDKYDSVGGYAPADAAAGVAAVQDPRVAGTAHAAPEQPRPPTFDELDPLGGAGSLPVPPRSSAPAAFARSAVAGALDTAALPVTLPARAYRAAGGRGETLDTIADLQADEALQDATWLATGEEAGDYRARVKAEREQFPNASAAGAEIGAAAGGVGLGGLAERGAARGIAGRISQRTAEERVRTLGRAYADALELGDEELAQRLKKRIQLVQPYRGDPEKRAVGKSDVDYKDGLAKAESARAEAAEMARREQPDVKARLQADRRQIDEMRARNGQSPIFSDADKGLAFDASGPVTGQARTATREQAQEKQRTYTEK